MVLSPRASRPRGVFPRDLIMFARITVAMGGRDGSHNIMCEIPWASKLEDVADEITDKGVIIISELYINNSIHNDVRFLSHAGPVLLNADWISKVKLFTAADSELEIRGAPPLSR